MNGELIDLILHDGIFTHPFASRKLVETHISYVILGDAYAYKFKKDIKYSFLDFSTLARRKYYCEREVALNNRLTAGVYLGVVPVRLCASGVCIGGREGDIVDYAVKMKRLDEHAQMHFMLERGLVDERHIRSIAEVIRTFHDRAEVIRNPVDIGRMATKFNDIRSVAEFVRTELGAGPADQIAHAVRVSDQFLARHQDLLATRVAGGYVRDCHGDLHSRNIFLCPQPVIFDCLEFNDEFRQIDILDELAFFCMDLEAAGADRLGSLFVDAYFTRVDDRFGREERLLFTYYKSYRANVRAKVNVLRAMRGDEAASGRALREFKRYLTLVDRYLAELG